MAKPESSGGRAVCLLINLCFYEVLPAVERLACLYQNFPSPLLSSGPIFEHNNELELLIFIINAVKIM